MKKFILFIALLFPFLINAQEEHGQFGENHGDFKHWQIAATMSQSYVPALHIEEGETSVQFIPTNGIEVTYAFNHKLFVKWVNEIEFQNYSVKGIDGEHRIRENTFLTALVLGYEIYEHVGVFAGAGYEFEKNENLWVTRAGVEYSFNLPGNWVLAPAFVFDYKKESHTAYTFSLSVGKKF